MASHFKASKGRLPSSKAKPPKPTQSSATSGEPTTRPSEPPHVYYFLGLWGQHVCYSLGLWGSSSEKTSHLSCNRVSAQEVLNLLSVGGPPSDWQLSPAPGADAVACAVNPTPPPAGILDPFPSHKVQGKLFTLLQVITSSSLK